MVTTFETALKESQMAENTITAYLYAVNDFYGKYKSLSKKNLLLYKTYLIEHFKPKTVNLRIQALNKFLEHIGKPKLRLKSVKVQQRTYLENVISQADYLFLKEQLRKEENLMWYFVVRNYKMAHKGAKNFGLPISQPLGRTYYYTRYCPKTQTLC